MDRFDCLVVWRGNRAATGPIEQVDAVVVRQSRSGRLSPLAAAVRLVWGRRMIRAAGFAVTLVGSCGLWTARKPLRQLHYDSRAYPRDGQPAPAKNAVIPTGVHVSGHVGMSVFPRDVLDLWGDWPLDCHVPAPFGIGEAMVCAVLFPAVRRHLK